MSKKDLVSEEVLQELTNKIQEIVNNYCWNLEYFTEDEVQDFFQASSQEITYYNGLINDNIESKNFLWSSKKIAEELAKAIIEADGYTDSLLKNISSIQLEWCETSLPTTGEANKIYILPVASGGKTVNTLNIWNSTSNNWVSIGNLEIDITQFYNKTEIDTKMDLKANKTEVVANDKINQTLDSTTNSSDTVLSTSGLQIEMDKKANDNEVVKKTSLVTSIDSTSTDTQVPSAKAIYDKYSFHDLSEANTNVLDNALFVDTHNQNSVNNKDCLVTSSSIGIPDNLLWGIRQVFWHADSDLVLKITGKDINNKGCIWINSLTLKDGKYSWQGWSKNVTSGGSEGVKLLTIKQANACAFSGETMTSNSDDLGGGCVFTAPLGVKTVAFDLISNGILCQFGLCNMSGTLPTVITKGDNRIEYVNTGTSGTYYIKNINGGNNVFIGGGKGMQISNVRITEWY